MTQFQLIAPDSFILTRSFFSSLSLASTASFAEADYDEDCYYNLPTHYLPNLTDPWFFSLYRRNNYVLATGWDDQCLAQNQNLDRILSEKEIPHKLYIWDAHNSHDWPTWERMVREYL